MFFSSPISKELKVGDMVEVKGWNEMVEQYGYYEEGERIWTACTNTSGLLFTRTLECTCGKQFRIVNVKHDSVCSSLVVYELDTPKAYQFCDTMLVKLEWYGEKRKYVRCKEYREITGMIEKLELELISLKTRLKEL